jgi:mRNA interferase MazF
VGTEIQKTRPCVVVSPDELNAQLNRVIVAPLTSTIRPFRFRVTATLAGRTSSVVLDQLRTVDVKRLGERIGKVDRRTMGAILATLQAMFAP